MCMLAVDLGPFKHQVGGWLGGWCWVWKECVGAT
jgi:hypothetical protein